VSMDAYLLLVLPLHRLQLLNIWQHRTVAATMWHWQACCAHLKQGKAGGHSRQQQQRLRQSSRCWYQR
jgi:hypothetical protein